MNICKCCKGEMRDDLDICPHCKERNFPAKEKRKRQMTKSDKVKSKMVGVRMLKSGQMEWTFPDMTPEYAAGFRAGLKAGKVELARKLTSMLED